jgi:hypothetical protein
VWEKGRPTIMPTINPFEILNSISTQSGGWSTHAISFRICSTCSAKFLLFFHLPFYCQMYTLMNGYSSNASIS